MNTLPLRLAPRLWLEPNLSRVNSFGFSNEGIVGAVHYKSYFLAFLADRNCGDAIFTQTTYYTVVQIDFDENVQL